MVTLAAFLVPRCALIAIRASLREFPPPASRLFLYDAVMRRTVLTGGILLLALNLLVAGYKIKNIAIKPAGEYSSHQSLQNVVIGARPFDTEEEILSVFDSKKLYQKQIMPVLIVVENNNDFAIRLSGRDIYLSDSGLNLRSIPYSKVVLAIAKKKKSSYSAHEDVLLGQIKNKDMVADFERKSFEEKLIAPHGSDFGIVFFELIQLTAETKIYIPSITNLETQQFLMFFEFTLS